MFEKYNYVYAVYKEKSFTKGAEKLFISQPSLSAAIKNIENKVGAKLFERNGSGVKLTDVGVHYIAAAEKMMSAQNDFIRKIHDIYNLETGEITVGGTNYLSSYILPEIVNAYALIYPKIKVTLVEANSITLNEMIKNEQLDIVIDSFDENEDIHQRYPLFSERILMCVPKDNEINKSLTQYKIDADDIYNGNADFDKIKSVPVKMFKNEKFVLLKQGNDMYNRAMTIFEKNKIMPYISFSVDQLNISYALAESGMGICFLTDTLFKYGRFRNNVILYKADESVSSRNLYIAHKKNRYCTRVMSEFIKVAKEVISKRNS